MSQQRNSTGWLMVKGGCLLLLLGLVVIPTLGMVLTIGMSVLPLGLALIAVTVALIARSLRPRSPVAEAAKTVNWTRPLLLLVVGLAGLAGYGVWTGYASDGPASSQPAATPMPAIAIAPTATAVPSPPVWAFGRPQATVTANLQTAGFRLLDVKDIGGERVEAWAKEADGVLVSVAGDPILTIMVNTGAPAPAAAHKIVETYTSRDMVAWFDEAMALLRPTTGTVSRTIGGIRVDLSPYRYMSEDRVTVTITLG